MTTTSHATLAVLTSASLLVGAAISTLARAEALSTSSLGFASRTLTYVSAKEAQGTIDQSQTPGAKNESLSDALICQRISTPSSLGLELGAGGCLQGGGFWTFMQSTSAYVQLIYYPFTPRTTVTNDGALTMSRQFLLLSVQWFYDLCNARGHAHAVAGHQLDALLGPHRVWRRHRLELPHVARSRSRHRGRLLDRIHLVQGHQRLIEHHPGAHVANRIPVMEASPCESCAP